MLSAAYIGVPGAQMVLLVDPSETLPTAPALQPSLGAADPSGFWQLICIHGAACAALAVTVAAAIASSAVSDRTPSVARSGLAACRGPCTRIVSPIVVWSAGVKALVAALSIRD